MDLDLSLNESETNMTVTEEKIVSVTSLHAILKHGNILELRIHMRVSDNKDKKSYTMQKSYI